MCSSALRDLVPEGATAAIETDPNVARLKSSADLVKAIEPAVRFYERPPAEGMTVETPWSAIWLSPDDWAEALQAPDPGTPHNEARDQILKVMAEAEPVIRAVLPDANVPISIRASGLPVGHGRAADLDAILDSWLAAHAEGIGCVIGDPAIRGTSRVRSLTPVLAKGSSSTWSSSSTRRHSARASRERSTATSR